MIIVNSIVELKAASIPTDNYARVLGYHLPGDGGSGDFFWDATSNDVENAGTIFESNVIGSPGRWKRLYSGSVYVKWFGAKGDGVTDDTQSLFYVRDFVDVISSGSNNNYPLPEILFNGRFLITESPNWSIRNLTLRGVGLAEIICTGSGPVLDLWYYSETAPRGVSNIQISNLLLTGNPNTSACFRARAVSRSLFSNIICQTANSVSGSGFLLCACVCNTFIKPMVSVNFNSNMQSIPYYGISFIHDDGPSIIGNSTANKFEMIIIEGVQIGIHMEEISADINTFNQGTSEANTTGGIFIGPNNRGNVFKDIAMEFNEDYDITDKGINTVIDGGYSTGIISFENTRFSKITQIRAQQIHIDTQSINTRIEDLSINNWSDPVTHPPGGLFNHSTTSYLDRIRDWENARNLYMNYYDRFRYRLVSSNSDVIGDTQNLVVEVNAFTNPIIVTIQTSPISEAGTLKIIKNNGTQNVTVIAGVDVAMGPATSIVLPTRSTVKILSNAANSWRVIEKVDPV